ncbi:MAG: SDR family NAD(P)-dependent oxidoreductase [Candidatus Puniceispirillaceae bacterium]
MTYDFTGKVAAVTGSSGIGLGAALHLARCGARVFLAGIDAALNSTAGDLAAEEGLDITLHQVDVADEASVRGWADAIAGATDVLHALVNAAGLQTYGTVEDTSPADWDHCLAVNLRSCYLTSHCLYPLLKAAGGASVVHVASVQGHNNQHRVLAYATSKGAVHAMTRAMAMDCAKDKVRVNSVSPGSIRTPLLEFGASQLAGDGRSVDDMIAEFGKSHPIGRVGTTEETGSLIAYLCSDDAGFITGTDLRIDGGLTAKLCV